MYLQKPVSRYFTFEFFSEQDGLYLLFYVHLSMGPHRVLSKVCTSKIQERDYKMHKSNLSQAKSVLDVAPPPSMSFPHIKVKAKRIKNIQGMHRVIWR